MGVSNSQSPSGVGEGKWGKVMPILSVVILWTYLPDGVTGTSYVVAAVVCHLVIGTLHCEAAVAKLLWPLPDCENIVSVCE